jgi:hypothetical protein
MLVVYTYLKEKSNGAVSVIVGVVILLLWLDYNTRE